MKIIGLILLAVGLSVGASAQLSGNLELRRALENEGPVYGLGASLQYLFYYDHHFLPGMNVGFIHEVGQGSGRKAYTMPVLLQARYYLLGVHGCSGGLYTEGMAGVGFRKQSEQMDDMMRIENSAVPQASISLGYRSPMSYDYNFRLGLEYLNDQLINVIGFKLGYTF